MNSEKRFDYEADWGPYAFPRQKSHIARAEELRKLFSSVDLSRAPAETAGIPLVLNGSEAIVNGETENTVIFGETGSKKTRCVIRPLMYSLIGAGESMFITDPKGELASDSRIRGYLDERGYQSVFLDFRDFRGDSCNIFDHAIRLYREGKKEKAVESVGGIIHALAVLGASEKTDPFWTTTTEELCVPAVHLLLELYASDDPDKINMGSLAALINSNGTDCLRELLGESEYSSRRNPEAPLANVRNASMTMLRGALCGSDKTTANVIVSAFSVLQPFLFNEALLRMTSCATFDVGKMYERPTAVFLIVPDECSTYDRIAGILLDGFYRRLIEEFTARYQNRMKPPCRVNFVCDEFCNVKINDMGPKISACRSREIRFFLVCQSKSQLEQVYSDDSLVILGNCRNLFFLSSSDPELLSYISDRCGTTVVTDSGAPEPLVSVEMLKRLRKERDHKEAVFLRDDLICHVLLPDCDAPAYGFLDRFRSEEADIPAGKQKKPDAVTLEQFRTDVTARSMTYRLFRDDRMKEPSGENSADDRTEEDYEEFDFDEEFGSDDENGGDGTERAEDPSGIEEFDLQAGLEKKFNELFGVSQPKKKGSNH